MIRLLIGSSDQVAFLNESMFSVIDYDKNEKKVCGFILGKDGFEKVLTYDNVKEVDYIQDGKFFEHIHNVIHFQEV